MLGEEINSDSPPPPRQGFSGFSHGYLENLSVDHTGLKFTDLIAVLCLPTAEVKGVYYHHLAQTMIFDYFFYSLYIHRTRMF